MKIVINENPIPAKRMTGKTMWYGQAKKYVEYKNRLAEELNLHLLGNPKGSTMVVTEKWDKKTLPIVLLVELRVKFYRDSNRVSDIDNLLKMVMDMLQTAGVVKNDDQVRKVVAEVVKPVAKGMFEIEIKPILSLVKVK